MAHAGGRPTKYEPGICERMIKYFDKDPMKEAKFDKRGNLQVGPIPPTFERFAFSEGVIHETLQEWAKDPNKPEFSGAYKKCKQLQRSFYTQALASNLAKGAAPIFIAKNETNMVDQQSIDHTTKGQKISSVDAKSLALLEEYEKKLKEQFIAKK